MKTLNGLLERYSVSMKPVFPGWLLSWLKRAFLWTSAIVLALSITGRIYLTAATKADAEKVSPR